MDLLFCAFFLHPDFWGSIFQLHFLHFSPKYLFTAFQKEAAARPHKCRHFQLDCNQGSLASIMINVSDTCPAGARVIGIAAPAPQLDC